VKFKFWVILVKIDTMIFCVITPYSVIMVAKVLKNPTASIFGLKCMKLKAVMTVFYYLDNISL
jgi:hypothetical protein